MSLRKTFQNFVTKTRQFSAKPKTKECPADNIHDVHDRWPWPFSRDNPLRFTIGWTLFMMSATTVQYTALRWSLIKQSGGYDKPND